MNTKILLCVLIYAQAICMIRGQPQSRPVQPPSSRQVNQVSDAAMLATFRRILNTYYNRDACNCNSWPDNFNTTGHFFADFSTRGAFVAPLIGMGVSWYGGKPSGTLPCQKRGVLKLQPPSWANSLTIDLCLNNPTEWSFHLGDDTANNGYGGGAVNWKCAEVHAKKDVSLVYRAFDGTNREKLLINYFRNSVSSGPYTIKVKKPSTKGGYVGINNYEGLDADIYDDLLFAWDTMYFGINRVVQSTFRQGTGLCFINIRWEA